MTKLISFNECILILLLSFGSLGLSLQLRDRSCPPEWSYGSDSNVYLDLAKNIRERKGYLHSPGIDYPGTGIVAKNTRYLPSLHLLPGYPLLLAAAFSIWDGPRAPFGLAWVLFVAMSLSVYATAKLLFEKVLPPLVVWTVFVIFQTLQPILILQLQAIGRDLAAASFTAVFLLALLWMARSPKPSAGIFVAVLAATLAALSIRTNLFALVLPLSIGIGVLLWRKREIQKVWMIGLDVLLIVTFIVAWGMHLKTLTGRFMLGVDKGFGLYVNYAYSYLPPGTVERDMREVAEHFNTLVAQGIPVEQAEAAVCDEYQKKAMHFLFSHPRLAARAFLRNMTWTLAGKDYYWMPRLLFVKFSGSEMKNFDYKFNDIYHRSHSLLARALYQAFNIGCVVIYIILPIVSIFATPFLYFLTGRTTASQSTGTDGRWLLCMMALSAILFLFSTALFGAHARYRIPTTPISVCCILGTIHFLTTYRPFRRRSHFR